MPRSKTLAAGILVSVAAWSPSAAASLPGVNPPRTPGFKSCGGAGLPIAHYDLRVKRTSCRRGRKAVRRYT